MRDEIYEQEIPDSIVRSFTPRPQKPPTLDFPDAMREIIAGKKIKKLEWAEKNAPECFAVLTEGRLKVFRAGQLFDWIISDGDLAGEDYVVTP